MAEENINIGTAHFTLVPSMDGTEGRVRSALGGVDTTSVGRRLGTAMANGIASSLKASTVAIGNVVSNIVSSVAAGMGGLISEATGLSDAMVKFEQSMAFAGFDPAVIAASEKAIQDYADKTVYNLDEVVTTSQILATNGIPNFVDLTQAIGNLNAVAGGNANTFGSVAQAVTQTVGVGKLMTENWRQLTEAIPGATGVLKDALTEMGAYTGNFEEAMSQGQISAEEFNQALLAVGMNELAAEAATSTATMEGALGNARAAIVGSMADIYDAVNGDGRVTGAITAVGDAFGGLLQKAAGPLGELAERVFSLFETGDPATIAGGLATVLTDSIQQVADMAASGMPQAAQLVSSVLSGLVDALLAAVPGLVSSIGGLAASIVPAIVEIALGVVRAVADALPQMIGGLAQALLELAPVLFDAAAGAFASIVEALPTIVSDLLVALAGVVAEFVASLPEHIPSILESAKNVYSSLVDGLVGVIPDLLRALGDGVGALVGAFPTYIPALLKAAAQLFAAILEAFFSFDWLSIGVDIMLGIAKGIVSAIGTVISSFLGALGDVVSAGLRFLGIHSPSRLFFEVGGFVDEGLANGLEAHANEPVRAMVGVAEDVYEAMPAGNAALSRADGAQSAAVGQSVTYNVSIDGDTLTADSRMIALLREFVAGAAEKQGRRVVFA